MTASYDYVLGGSMALASAFLWAVASLIWNQLNRQQITPIAISLGKAVLACLCFTFATFFIQYDIPDGRTYLLLTLSGLLGISIGDTTFFYSLKYLGPRRCVLLTVLIPITTALLASLFLNERLSFLQWVGMFACLGGVTFIAQERIPHDASSIDKRRGIIWGCVSVLACSASILISKTALSVAGAFEASFIRLQAGLMGLVLYCIFNRQCFRDAARLLQPAPLKLLFLGSFLGTFLGIWFSIMALKYTLASVATVLTGTSPVFILPLAYWFLKERISTKAIFATVVAVIGGAMVLVF